MEHHIAKRSFVAPSFLRASAQCAHVTADLSKLTKEHDSQDLVFLQGLHIPSAVRSLYSSQILQTFRRRCCNALCRAGNFLRKQCLQYPSNPDCAGFLLLSFVLHPLVLHQPAAGGGSRTHTTNAHKSTKHNQGISVARIMESMEHKTKRS